MCTGIPIDILTGMTTHAMNVGRFRKPSNEEDEAAVPIKVESCDYCGIQDLNPSHATCAGCGFPRWETK
jgi:hypothetical protein